MKDRHPFIQAFLYDDRPLMKSMVRDLSVNDPSYTLIRAICFDYEPKLSRKERLDWVRKAMENPPNDLEFFIPLLWTLVFYATHLNLLDDSERAIRLLDQMPWRKLDPELKAVILKIRWWISHSLCNYPDELKYISEAVECVNGSRTPLWNQLKAFRIRSALENDDFSVAEKDLEDIRDYKTKNSDYMVSHPFLFPYYLCKTGRIAQAYQLMLKNQEYISAERSSIWLRLKILIRAGRFEEAQSDLEKTRKITSLYMPFIYSMESGYLSMAKKDLAAARIHAQDCVNLTMTGNPSLRSEAQQLMALVELASGNTQAARVVLSQLNPQENKSMYSGEMLRLYLLEGNRPKAMTHLKAIEKQNIPELLSEKLRFAHELSFSEMTHLLLESSTISDRVSSISITSKVKQVDPDENISLIGRSSSILQIREQIRKLARQQSTVLIEGEAGTGKELVARLIHENSSRSNEPFISINCISNSYFLVESQLLGHVEKGFSSGLKSQAGSFVQAGKGTILLKEIDLASPHLQTQILQCLERGEFYPLGSTVPQKIRARFIINSTVDLNETLRKDLYFVLSRVHIRIPPLRERKEDIPLLAIHFLKKHFSQFEISLSEELLEAMQAYFWPGNIHEFEEEIKRMVMISKGSQTLRPHLFQPQLYQQKSSDLNSETYSNSPSVFAKSPVKVGNFKHRMTRQQAILELFNQNEKLTPSLVVQLLGCSLKTASTDLMFLEKKGLMRRVLTSTHLRTSYYVQTNSSLVRQS